MPNERTGQRRELRDQVVLGELAHPVRLWLLEEPTRLGRATATELSPPVGESSANSELQDLVARWFERHAERLDPAARPPDCRPVRFTAWAFPTEP